MRLFDVYIYRKLTAYLFVIFPAFSLVSVLVELIEIIRKSKVQDFSLMLIYIFAKLPENFYYIIPVSLTISAFLVANDLIKSREIYPILLNGISLNYISSRIIIFSVIVSFIQLLNLELLMPKTNRIYTETYQRLKNQPLDNEKAIAYNLWLKLDEKTFIYFDFFDLEKKIGKEIVIIKMDKDFNPYERWEASDFKVNPDRIDLFNGKEVLSKSIEDVKVSKFEKIQLSIGVDTEKIKKLIKEKKPVSLSQVYKVAKIAQNYGYDASYFWSQFYQKLATVISPFVLAVFISGFIWNKNKLITFMGFLSIVLYWYGTSIIAAIASVGNIPYYFIFSFDALFLFVGFYLIYKTKHPEL
ncbi:LptF/LptG family permease [Sulfurihydrogenibium sp.]|uniref:LptF/LptG family permease n=1 Tax=Sulfurihydrogenibium sp. TaxID=2053621 RepID=UPI002607C2B5|nr:LptF/LptG family permease [Sulfurihydrogenibium sp.]